MDLTAVTVYSQRVYLTWDPPPVMLQNGVIREYYINVSGIETRRVLQYKTTSTEIEITSLHPSYTYNFSVSAFTVALGPFSEPYTITMLEDGKYYGLMVAISINYIFYTAPSGPPQNIQLETNSSRSINVHWEPPLADQQNGVIIGYTVNVTEIGGQLLSFDTTEETFNINGLTPHTLYEIVISARTSSGAGPFSPIITVQTHQEGEYIAVLL